MKRKVFDRLNQRRHELITKKFSVGLSAREEKVYDRLQNSDLLSYYVGHLDFRWLIRILTEMKLERRRLYPKGNGVGRGGKEQSWI